MSDLTDTSIAQLGVLIKERKISPVELTQAYFENIHQLNSTINAFVTLTEESALAEAKQAESEIAKGRDRGPLHGIPIAYKDIYCTDGVLTTCCSQVLADYIPNYDATVVRQWKQAGVIMLGKLNTHEFAYGTRNTSSSYGPVRNPWDLSRHTGGSSGGSAAAVLLAMCAGATGSDSGGSIRMPAAACGITGLKPTFGLGSRHGIFPLMWTMDHPGPMGRTVLDCALMLQPMAGYDSNDSTTAVRKYPDFTVGIRHGVQGLRIGIARRYFYECADPEVEATVLDALKVLEQLGAIVGDVDIEYIEHAATASGILHFAEAAAYHDDTYVSSPELFTPETRRNLELGNYILAKDYLHAQRYRRLLGLSFQKVFREVDIVATPTIPLVASKIEAETVNIRGEMRSVHLSMLHNTEPCDLTGLPALSLPCGFSSEQLPIGLQLIGRPFEESLVLRAGYAFEQATEWHKQRPAIMNKALDAVNV